MKPHNSRPIPILAFNEDTISAIHMPQTLTLPHNFKDHVNSRPTKPIEIEPYPNASSPQVPL